MKYILIEEAVIERYYVIEAENADEAEELFRFGMHLDAARVLETASSVISVEDAA